jgi:primosomal protein N' (replication factor Y)
VAYAEVIVAQTNRRLDKPFYYAIPNHLESKISLGTRVIVPFRNRFIPGVVVGFVEKVDIEHIKEIKTIQKGKPFFTERQLELARWMADYYICPLNIVLQSIIPGIDLNVKSREEKSVQISHNFSIEQMLVELKRAPKQKELLLYLVENSPVKLKDLTGSFKNVYALVNSLVEKGFAEVVLVEPLSKPLANSQAKVTLTLAQKNALEYINDALVRKKYKPILLYGVTGSGKTEVYLRALERNKQSGRQAIVLLPEIGLTDQMLKIFSARFGHEVVTWHSNITAKEKRQAWEKMISGKASIIVGARSAIFAPFSNLGLIIIDEEHENSYYQEQNPKYHAREVGLKRGMLEGATVLLGSATPSLETSYKASTGEYGLATLNNRIKARPLPKVEIVDLRLELQKGNFSIFSELLHAKIKERLEAKEQVILFINRRGYNNFFICRDCGYNVRCKSCDISLTYHATSQELKCHYCGYRQSIPEACPKCGSARIRGFGIGTERVEQEVNKYFPTARVARLDTDMAKRDYRKEVLNKFKAGKIDILVGTQMIAKGFDFHGVTLVGVISADLSLNMPDFRARERTFQLLTQVAGRAGRGEKAGEVVIQTYWPENEVVLAAQKQDYKGFYQSEILNRKELGYPPFSHVIRILVFGEFEEKVREGCHDFVGILKEEVVKRNDVAVLGPAPAPISKLQDLYRWQVILKGSEITELRHVTTEAIKRVHELTYVAGQLRWSIDVDPLGML